MIEYIPSKELIDFRFTSMVMRQNVYKNVYDADCDIVDNPLTVKVGATRVCVNVEKTSGKNPKVKRAVIFDNGCGMDKPGLLNALHIGRDNGQDPTTDLGFYGAGLKAAGTAYSDTLTILTKVKGGALLKGFFDYQRSKNPDEIVGVEDEVLEDDVQTFEKYLGKNAENGTVVLIENFKKDFIYQNHVEQLTKKMGLLYAYFIVGSKYVGNRKIEFYLNNKSISPIFLENGCKVIRSFDYPVPGHKNPLHVVNLYVPETELPVHNGIARSLLSSGVSIFRNGRCVGFGLNMFGVVQENGKHSLGNCFRSLIFADGTYDALLGCNYTKVVNEKTKDEIPEELEELVKMLRQDKSQAREMDEKEKKGENDIQKNKDREKNLGILNLASLKISDVYQFATLPFNKVERRRGGEHHKHIKPTDTNPNPKPRKPRTPNCPITFGFESNGPHDMYYRVWYEDNKVVVLINENHPYYNYFNGLSERGKICEALRLASNVYAKYHTGYFNMDDEFVKDIVDDYESYVSEAYFGAFRNEDKEVQKVA